MKTCCFVLEEKEVASCNLSLLSLLVGQFRPLAKRISARSFVHDDDVNRSLLT